MSAPEPTPDETRMRRRLNDLLNAPDGVGNRCIECAHVKHNELGYCQTKSCSCDVGTSVTGQVSTIVRDLPALLGAVRKRALTDGAALGRRATNDPGAFTKRGADYDGNPYGERLDQWQTRALAAAIEQDES